MDVILFCSQKCRQSGNVDNFGGPVRVNGNHCWLADWLLAAWKLTSGTFWDHFWSIFALFWGHWPSFWDHWAPLWDHWAPLCPMWGQRIDFRRFLGDSLTPWGIPSSPLGVTFSLSGALEAENWCFLGQLVSRSDFRTKSGRILGCLGWLKQWFRV